MSSRRLGEGLSHLIRQADAIPPYVAQVRPPYPAVSITPTGPEDPKLLESALALFRYTTTTEDADWRLVSSRAQRALQDDAAFDDMMTDAKTRAESLAKRHIRLGVDMSQLHATPVAVSGLPFCDPRPDLQWVQVSGSVIFTYDSPSAAPREPVAWPKDADILFATTIEDGVRKFDGYCPEPSLPLPPADRSAR